MELFRSTGGVLCVELITADDTGALCAIRAIGVELRNIEKTDALTFRFEIRKADLYKLRRLAQRRGETVRVRSTMGLYRTLLHLKRRPVLLFGAALLLAVSLLLPGKILFVRTQGNETIPTRLLLEKAAQCGVCMGASGREIRSERVKNRLLSEIPQLQWVGVNIYGCVAVVSVRERTPEAETEEVSGVTSLVAERDGVISSITVTQGTALCRAGEAVVAGQTLISGFTDCGSVTLATRAKGQIRALTRHDLTVVSPLEYDARGEIVCTERKISLFFGKKRINFYKGSGILDTGCAKIREQWYLTLPGGFVLPIGLICEVYIQYAPAQEKSTRRVALSKFAAAYTLAHCRDGEILNTLETTQDTQTLAILRAAYACRESLGMTQEEATLPNGKNNGADRQRGAR